ncbi:polymer-forming cytoskeletal protein [Maridesulfovibrio sp.]|uniref:bactofilin family protein n=1 Tax=Maridesulfovibrio sp. TaxID=2795000 RepID=UPI0029C9E930|nr:polymer-forming cytoskeletal protein [Maridesulfovibrio sp.]
MARDEINAFLGSGTDYQGKLNFQGAVRIDGNFNGEVESEGTLVVGKEARVEGVLRVGQLVLSGRLNGEVYASEKAVLHKTANLQGNLVTPSLVVEEGAVLEGRVTMSSSPSSEVETETEEIS